MKNTLILLIASISFSFASCDDHRYDEMSYPNNGYYNQPPQNQSQWYIEAGITIGYNQTTGTGVGVPPIMNFPVGIGWVRANATDVLVGNGVYCYSTSTTYWPITIFISNNQVTSGYVTWAMAHDIEKFARDYYIPEYDWIKIIYTGMNCDGGGLNNVTSFAP